MNGEKAPYLSKGLDYYKATMSQVAFEKHPDAQVTFALKNRGENLLSEYVSPEELQTRLDAFRGGWQPEEIAHLAELRNQDGGAQFSNAFLTYLGQNELPRAIVGTDNRGDIAVEVTGDWPLASFWETVAMSEINEIYFANKLAQEGRSIDELYNEGDRRLAEKIALLKNRPDIKIADFGTRRRFGYDWHQHVVERLATELPDNFMGTSNIHLARTLGLKAIGTYAHEMPMVYAAIADKEGRNPLAGHGEMLTDWEDVYRGDLSVALTDTFTSEFFFNDFTREQASSWKGLRHDSGDPFEFGERAIEYYKENGVDPREKTLVFSDGLDVTPIIELADRFNGRVQPFAGWGTTLTNDLGLKANNMVMKAVRVDGVGTVKLSDNIGKHTGDAETIARYEQRVAENIGVRALHLVEV